MVLGTIVLITVFILWSNELFNPPPPPPKDPLKELGEAIEKYMASKSKKP